MVRRAIMLLLVIASLDLSLFPQSDCLPDLCGELNRQPSANLGRTNPVKLISNHALSIIRLTKPESNNAYATHAETLAWLYSRRNPGLPYACLTEPSQPKQRQTGET